MKNPTTADEADAAAKILELHSEQAGLRADRERLAAVQQGKRREDEISVFE